MASTKLVLQPHLRQRLDAVSPLLDGELRKELEAVLAQPEVEASHASAPLAGGEEGSDIAPQKEESHSSVTEATPAVDPSDSTDETEKSEKTDIGGEEDAEDEQPEIIPPTVDVDLLDRLSRWTSRQGASLRKAGLDPAEYSYIALLAGTSAYLPRAQVRALRDAEQASEKPSPYLPSHLSATLQPTFASEYRQLTRLLSTILNILFSVFGCGFAAYVAATTGAGWSRENAVLLAVAVGAIVGVADAGIVFLYKRRVKEDGVRSAKLRAKYSRGTGATGVLLERDGEGEITKEIEVAVGEGTVIPAPKREVRLRRRAVAEKH